MFWRERKIVRRVQIFEHLLGHAMKHRRRYLAALMEPNGGIQNYRDYDLRIIYGSESRERADVFGFRIRARGGIDFLRRASFPADE